MLRIWLVLACASCERSTPPPRLDVCVLVATSDVSALFGHPAAMTHSLDGGCVWTAELADAKWALSLDVGAKPMIIVTHTDITIDGKRMAKEPEVIGPIVIGTRAAHLYADAKQATVGWQHDERMVHLELHTSGTAPTAMSQIGGVEQLAQKIEAALATR